MGIEQLKSFLISSIKPDDLEHLVAELLLIQGYIELHPTGGVNDRGVDAKLFTFSHQDTDWVVQISTEHGITNKIKKTLDRLMTLTNPPVGLVYVTNQVTNNFQREKLGNIAVSQGILLRILDANWISRRVDVVNHEDLRPTPLVAGLQESEIFQIKLPRLLEILLTEATSSLSTIPTKSLVIANQAIAAGIHSFQLRHTGHFIQALQESAKSYRLAHSLTNPSIHLFAAHLHGESLKITGRTPQAAEAFAEFMKIADSIAQPEIIAAGNTNLAETVDDIDLRLEHSRKAGSIYEKLNSLPEIAISLGQRSKLNLLNGNIPAALSLAEESASVSKDHALFKKRGIAKAELHRAKAKFADNALCDCKDIAVNAATIANSANDLKTATRALLLSIECSIKLRCSQNEIDCALIEGFSNCFELADYGSLRKLQGLLRKSRS